MTLDLPRATIPPLSGFRHFQAGFTLTELAVVLVIVALLIGGMLIPLSTQQDIQARQETARSLAQIHEALIGFAVVNGRLPCPAPATLDDQATGAGLEATTAAAGTTATTGPCGCTTATSGIASAGVAECSETAPDSITGVLPWATLGVPKTDAWGNRFTYRVTTRFGRLASGQTTFGCTPASNPVAAAFALCSAGNMNVYATSGGTVVASNVAALVLSHGRNSAGAYTPAGNQLAGAAGDELENADADADFVSAGTVDDQLAWISTPLLMNRMITAGRLP